MPELPEVETITRQLARRVRGQRLLSVRILDPKLALSEKEIPLSSRVSRVTRAGKQIVIQLSRKDRAKLYLVIHLRMTGYLIWKARPSLAQQTIDQHEPRRVAVRAELHFERGRLVFEDLRRFGTLALYADERSFTPRGIDPTTEVFTNAWLRLQLARSKQEIKAWLLRQDKLCGVGNIYACEALFKAGIQPRRQGESLTTAEVTRLRKAIREVLLRSIRHAGTTFSDYQDVLGRSGRYQRLLKVYKREGEQCLCCGKEILRCKQQQRSTYYCSGCQR